MISIWIQKFLHFYIYVKVHLKNLPVRTEHIICTIKKEKKCIHVNYFQMTEYHLESSYHRFNSSNHVCSINSSLKINTIEEKSGPKIKI